MASGDGPLWTTGRIRLGKPDHDNREGHAVPGDGFASEGGSHRGYASHVAHAYGLSRLTHPKAIPLLADFQSADVPMAICDLLFRSQGLR